MTVNDILTLLNAGYTKEEITAMNTNSADPEKPVPAEQEKPVPADQEKPVPADPEKPVPAEQEKPADDEIKNLRQEVSETRKQITDLVKQMQANNRQIASVNILPGDDLDKRTDDAMAELIRPKLTT